MRFKHNKITFDLYYNIHLKNDSFFKLLKITEDLFEKVSSLKTIFFFYLTSYLNNKIELFYYVKRKIPDLRLIFIYL